MAQAFANIYGAGNVQAYSAGSRPSGKVNPKATSAMKELGYDLSVHQSKSLDELPDVEFDYAITMGCGDACPLVRAKHRLDWSIPDPRDMNEDEFRKVRDIIGDKVKEVLNEIKAEG